MMWVININTNTCHIYKYKKSPLQFNLIKEVSHPENKLKKSEFLTSDKPGHYQANDSRGVYQPHSDPKEVEIDNFAREIAKELESGRVNHSYEHLVVIALPHIYGLLTKHLSENNLSLISHHIKKDLFHLNNNELLDYVKAHTKYPNEI